MFVKRVRETLKIPVLGLFDSDAHGLKILSVYVDPFPQLIFVTSAQLHARI